VSDSQPLVSSRCFSRKYVQFRRTAICCFASTVLCRITIRQENDRLIVHLAGRLGGEQVPDLLEVCSSPDRPPILELDELMSADVVGVDALRRIEAQGAELVGLPEYLRLKLTTLARERRP